MQKVLLSLEVAFIVKQRKHQCIWTDDHLHLHSQVQEASESVPNLISSTVFRDAFYF